MKTLAELQAIREKMQSQVNMRAEDHDHIRVVVGMATCGIAAGARPVLNTLADEVRKEDLPIKFPLPRQAVSAYASMNPLWKSRSLARIRLLM
mgnify:CR=1 FL=1